jgi:hypothetical protein
MQQMPEARWLAYRRARAAYLRRLSMMSHIPRVASALLDFARQAEADAGGDAAHLELAPSPATAR